MNFEERLAQTQAKLDELKAKINESLDSAKEAYQADKKDAMISIAKMNAAIEDFGRDVEAQALCDVTSMKEEAAADAATISAKMDEIGEKAQARAEKMDKALDDADDKIEAKIDEICDKADARADKVDKALDEVDDKIDAKIGEMCDKADARADKVDKALDEVDDKIDAKIAEDAAKYDAAAEKFQAKVDDALDTVEGDYYAVGEDLRIAKEEFSGKLNAKRLELQMKMEEIKAKIDAKKTEIDKAAQEDLIMDLLDYADNCQMIAYAYAMEAELAIMDACDEIEDYETKYGKSEE